MKARAFRNALAIIYIGSGSRKSELVGLCTRLPSFRWPSSYGFPELYRCSASSRIALHNNVLCQPVVPQLLQFLNGRLCRFFRSVSPDEKGTGTHQNFRPISWPIVRVVIGSRLEARATLFVGVRLEFCRDRIAFSSSNIIISRKRTFV